MRTLLQVFFIFNTACSIGQDSVYVDTLTFYNSGVSLVQKIDYTQEIMDEYKFDSVWNLLYEGSYEFVDSIKCFKCEEEYVSGEMVAPKFIYYLNHVFLDFQERAVAPIGEFNEYLGGKLSRTIVYDTMVHQYRYIDCSSKCNPSSSGSCPSSILTEFLINKIVYYDDLGDEVRIEYYDQGVLKSVWSFK